MGLLDEYLEENGTTRYQLAKISGLSQGLLATYRDKELKNYPVYLLEAIGMVIGKKSWVVLEEMNALNPVDDLNGFRELLNRYGYSFPGLEESLKTWLLILKKNNINVEPFSFNRFENEEHDNIEEDIEKAMTNAITMLEEAWKKYGK